MIIPKASSARVAVAVIGLVLAGCASESTPSGAPTSTAGSTTTVAPTTEPPVTEPPATEVPATEPPATEPAVTEPPVTEPAAPAEPTEPVFLGPPGTESQLSTVSFADTVANAVAAIEANANLTLFAQIDHAANAVAAGFELRPTTELIFGNAALGTPLMQASPTVGIDLPQKMLITEDASGNVGVFWNRPGYLVLRHGLDVPSVVDQVDTISAALRALGNAAAASDEPSKGGRPSPGAGMPALVEAVAPSTAREAADRLLAAIEADPDLQLVVEIDHSANAVAAGLTLDPIIEVIFGNPAVGTALMQASQTIGIDLPQKMLFIETSDGVRIVYNSPAEIAARHGVDPSLPQIGALTDRLAQLASVAATQAEPAEADG
jgi:uncharacterized protein (DUF302 family)